MNVVSRELAGRTWRWLEAGPADGPRVVFIHGAGGDGTKWEEQVRALAAVGCRTLAPDLPGHGGTDGPAHDTIEAYATAVGTWTRALGLSAFGLVGHSMGGAVVTEMALRGQPAAWLGLVGTGARLRVHPDTLARLGDADVPDFYLTAAFGVRPDAGLLAAERATWRSTDPNVRIADFTACNDFDAMGRLGNIAVPTAVIVGREDRMTPLKFSNYLAAEIAGAKLTVVDGAGHYVQLEAPDAVTGALVAMLSESM